MSSADQRLDLLRRYLPRFDAEYRRLGIDDEMARYFTGSGGGDLTMERFERELERLRSLPDAIGFERYCELVGIDLNALRAADESSR
jgi:hypothetical protein